MVPVGVIKDGEAVYDLGQVPVTGNMLLHEAAVSHSAQTAKTERGRSAEGCRVCRVQTSSVQKPSAGTFGCFGFHGQAAPAGIRYR